MTRGNVYWQIRMSVADRRVGSILVTSRRAKMVSFDEMFFPLERWGSGYWKHQSGLKRKP